MRGEIYPIQGPWPGQLLILARPRGNDWLLDEVQTWREAGVDVVVSLLGDSENIELGLIQERDVVIDQGLEFVSFPIPDYSVPKSEKSVLELTRQLHDLLTNGKRVGIHCRQSIGRSGLIAASVLVVAGEDPSAAFEHVRAGRGVYVPDTEEQEDWVYALAKNIQLESASK